MNKFLIYISGLLIFILSFSLFIIEEGSRGISVRFGKAVVHNHERQAIVYKPGLHLKWPFIDNIKIFDSKIQNIAISKELFTTKEKQDLAITSYIKWRISDFGRYYFMIEQKSVFELEVLLKKKFNNQLRYKISQLNIQDILNNKKNKITQVILKKLNDQISDAHVSSLINDNSLQSLGIEIVDLRIQSINVPSQLSNIIYSRMRNEREAIANIYRYKGKEIAEKICSLSNYQSSIILAKAQKHAAIIKGKGEAIIAKLFSKHFNKNPNFYFFIRTLRAYENSFHNNGNIIFMNSDSQFFQYFENIQKMII